MEFKDPTIKELQAALGAGTVTSVELVDLYLKRIDELDQRGPTLRSVIETNPEAGDLAKSLDDERRRAGPRGPLHGIPVLVKDNIDTADAMQTTAGSLALAGSRATRDAFVVKRLREAGAVILGKTNLTEWSNFRSLRSVSGWSGRGGQCRNPYSLDRTPWGSSAGSAAAVAADFAPAALGTETDGSIVAPAAACSLVGIKPSVGLTSRVGVIPISVSQDSVGPLARTVEDAAAVLDVIAMRDSHDARGFDGDANGSYAASLEPGALRGRRIGVPRRKFTGYSYHLDRVFESALQAIKEAGAILVDPADLPSADELTFLGPELTVLLYEFKDGINRYLAGVDPPSGVNSLRDLIEFNKMHADDELQHFGQDVFEMAEAKGALDTAEYRAGAARSNSLGGAQGIGAAMNAWNLDALVMPTATVPCKIDYINGDHITGVGTTPAAMAGYPEVNVPAGFVGEVPVGLLFTGRRGDEASLIRFGYAFEQFTNSRRPPKFLKTSLPE